MAKIRLFILILAVFGSSTLSANEGSAPVEGAPAAAPTDSLAVTLTPEQLATLDAAAAAVTGHRFGNLGWVSAGRE